MCTLILLRRPGHDWPVILGANRDEMIARPWRPPARHWRDRPEVVAGLDELAGGSWLGINDHGVAAGILNRVDSLGPAPGQRSRGELVLEALDHADADEAAAALGRIEPRAYRTFNMIIADSRDAFWLRHADETGQAPVEIHPIKDGLSMIAAGELDDPNVPRLVRYRPRFLGAAPPDPARGDWAAWEALLNDDGGGTGAGPDRALRFTTDRGFATVSSALIALPSHQKPELKSVFRFASHQPKATPWADVAL
jgi:Transport and Golgi organisation 2